jgi:cold shock CspA family protein
MSSSKRNGYISIWFETKGFGFIHENRDGKLFRAFLHVSNAVPSADSRAVRCFCRYLS